MMVENAHSEHADTVCWCSRCHYGLHHQFAGNLLGHEVVFSEKLSAPGDIGDAAFIDFSAYAIGIRREINLQKSIHAGFATDSCFYRLTTRVDGQPTWEKR